ncbi:MAG: hypothetical protein WCK36_04120, partial [Candidatus Firestonebacteria bacterium]
IAIHQLYGFFQFERLFYYALVQTEKGKRKEAAKALEALIKASKKEKTALNNIVEYLSGNNFIIRDGRVRSRNTLLSGYKIKPGIKKFIVTICAMYNKKIVKEKIKKL